MGKRGDEGTSQSSRKESLRESKESFRTSTSAYKISSSISKSSFLAELYEAPSLIVND